jgi:hypothetical protein
LLSANATEEFLVRNAPLYQVVGQMGFWGMIINGIQAAALEHEGMRTAPWNGKVIGFIVVYTVSMFILYSKSSSKVELWTKSEISCGTDPIPTGLFDLLQPEHTHQ